MIDPLAVRLMSLVLCLVAARGEESAGHESFPLEPVPSGPGAGFRQVPVEESGVDFVNRLEEEDYLESIVAHNGSGLALGDVDGDGRPDIYLCALQGPNRLYRNRGGWRFEEVDAGEAACSDQWSTGAVLVDVEGDGDADLLVNGVRAGTRLFRNDGAGNFAEAEDSGLSADASGMSMALADVDADGDLDLYCTHYIDVMYSGDPTTRYRMAREGGRHRLTHINGESVESLGREGRFVVSGEGKLRELPEEDELYLNRGDGRFEAVGARPGTFGDFRGEPLEERPRDWGLAATFADIDRDGHPDLYVCNDNASPDRIWINSGKGTFREVAPGILAHTSRSSMGVDVADIDRDGLDDFFVLDMFAREHERRMTQLVKQYSSPATILDRWARPRYNRNTLFMARSDGTYAETALMAGVAATGWSWCPLFLDADLDGFEDLLVSNGFAFDVLDRDSHDRIPTLRLSPVRMRRSRSLHPPLRERNAAFRNRGDGTFDPAMWGFDAEGISHGMAMADLDGDGDMDLVVNRLGEEALLLCNQASGPRIRVTLAGSPPNPSGIGARIRFRSGGLEQSQVVRSGGRYLSGDEPARTFAFLEGGEAPARLEVVWPDGAVSRVEDMRPDRAYRVFRRGAGTVAEPREAPVAPLFARVGREVVPPRRERERTTLEFHPHAGFLDTGGPGLGWIDWNRDGFEDLWVAGGREGAPAILINHAGLGLRPNPGTWPANESQGAIAAWSDGRGEATGLLAHREGGRIHILEGGASRRGPETGEVDIASLSVADVDGDGDLDLFVGCAPAGRRFPDPVPSQIWICREGDLHRDREWSGALAPAGLVTGSVFLDADGDDRPDLALACRWGAVRIYRNTGSGFEDRTERLELDALTGWWTGIAVGDFDGNGLSDLAVGNRGENTALAAWSADAFRLWYGNEGWVESRQEGARWLPLADRAVLVRHFPALRDRFPTHRDFARATVGDILAEPLESVPFLEARESRSGVFLNLGERFRFLPFPPEAQRAPAYAVNAADFDGDGREDVFLGQNDFNAADRITRNDAGQGLLLLGKGDGRFRALAARESGIAIGGRARGAALSDVNGDGRIDLAVAERNGPVHLLLNREGRPGLRIRLTGPPGNPLAIGARLRLVRADETGGPLREIHAGSGFASQDGAVAVLGMPERTRRLRIRWPGGREQILPIRPGQREVEVVMPTGDRR